MEESKADKTDFASFQEVADFLDSVLSYHDKGVLLECGDRDRLEELHFDFGVYIRNTFIFHNKFNRELARDCDRINGRRVVEDVGKYEMWDSFLADCFGGEIMELYYKWVKMISLFELRDM